MPRLRSRVERRSDFSIETVPTSVGRPDACCCRMSSTIARILLALGAVDEVRLLDALQRTIRGNHVHVEVVDLPELRRLGFRRAGHAGQLAVFAEVVLERDGRERLVLALDLHLLLGFDGLMQSVAPPPARHQAPRELVHDDDLTVLDHVLDVEVEQVVRAQRLLDVMEQGHIDRVVQTARSRHDAMPQHLLGLGHPALGQRHRLVLLVDEVVAGAFELLAILGLDVALCDGALLQPGDDAIDLVIEVGRFFSRSGDDERGARFVNQNAVDLVHDGVVVPALHHRGEVELHVVAEVVEPELVVGAVCDIRAVGDLSLCVGQLVLNDADAHAQKPVDAPHPL